jgi:MFS family permease
MLITGIFMLSRFSETFLALYAYDNFALETFQAPTIMLVFNAGWCLSSYPVGFFADRMNRYWFLAMGILFLILADHILASATSLTWVYVGCFFWGVQYGVTQNIFLSLIAEMVPSDLRGTGFGCYYIICAISAYCADHLVGVVSQHYGQSIAFSTSGVIAMVSLLTLIFVIGFKRKKKV